MSCKELIDSLHKAADVRIRLFWQEAEKEAASTAAEIAKSLQELRDDESRMRTAAARDENSRAIAEANNRARLIRLHAEKSLADRLYQIALKTLPALREKDYEEIFDMMTKELPRLAWQTVRVNPADAALARKYFPAAQIVPDETITGGTDASTGEGSIRIINTFEKRLERAWTDMLPELIKDIRYEVSNEPPSAN